MARKQRVLRLRSEQLMREVSLLRLGLFALMSLTLNLALHPFASAQNKSQNPPSPSSTNSTTGSISTTAASSSALAPRVREFQLFYRSNLGARSFANAKEQSQFTGLGLDLDTRVRLLPRLSARARAGLSLNSGYAQSQFGDKSPRSGVMMREAHLTWKAIDGETLRLGIRAGAIDQDSLNASLLVEGQPFPGVVERLEVGNENFTFALAAQQAIPTSSTLSTRAVESEVTPSFTTETAELEIHPWEGLTGKLFATHYRFTSLPSTVAIDSQALGNTIVELGPNTSRFRYEFDGFVAGGELNMRLSNSLSWSVSGHMLQNSKAPETYRNGQLVRTEFSLALPGDVDLKPGAEMFFLESDATPGFYASAERGQTNRHGWAADLGLWFRDERFKISGRYAEADVINTSLIQTAQRYFMIRFETFYEKL